MKAKIVPYFSTGSFGTPTKYAVQIQPTDPAGQWQYLRAKATRYGRRVRLFLTPTAAQKAAEALNYDLSIEEK